MAGDKKKNTTFKIIAVCLLVASAGIGIFLLLHGSESRTSSSGPEKSVGALTCKSQLQPNRALYIQDAKNSEQEVKITYSNGNPDKISYSYYGIFENFNQAEKASSNAHASYNKYMSENKLNPEILSPAFIVSNAVLRIDLYSSFNKLSNITAPLFFLSDIEFYSSDNTDIQTLQSFYAEKGFTCIIKNN